MPVSNYANTQKYSLSTSYVSGSVQGSGWIRVNKTRSLPLHGSDPSSGSLCRHRPPWAWYDFQHVAAIAATRFLSKTAYIYQPHGGCPFHLMSVSCSLDLKLHDCCLPLETPGPSLVCSSCRLRVNFLLRLASLSVQELSLRCYNILIKIFHAQSE